jgi:translation initiation factor 5A
VFASYRARVASSKLKTKITEASGETVLDGEICPLHILCLLLMQFLTLWFHLFRSLHRFMMIKGKPCKILQISVSKTGKHGHAKCNFLAVDIFTGKKLEDMIPSTHGTTVPIVNKSDWEIIDIEGDEVTLMDEGGVQKADLNLPLYPEGLAEEIREAWNGGENQVMVSVQSAVGQEQIISYKKDSA